jgi:CheY-like chemotaxis protein
MTRLLIVDDEQMIRENLECYLEDEGYETLTAESGEEALDIVDKEQGHIDLVIMDMRLPGIDGNETILKILEKYPSFSFVIHTGSSEYSLPQELANKGLTEENILMKPLPDMETMIKKIEQILSS